MTEFAYVALGSNLGDRGRHLGAAVEAMARLSRTEVLASVFETLPEGGAHEPPYWNTTALLSTGLDPQALLDGLLAIETARGRPAPAGRLLPGGRVMPEQESGSTGSGSRSGPRPLDLDLLLMGDRVLATRTLTLPHPRLAVRSFVLEPLVEMAEHVRHPVLGRTVGELYAALGSPESGRRLGFRVDAPERVS